MTVPILVNNILHKSLALFYILISLETKSQFIEIGANFQKNIPCSNFGNNLQNSSLTKYSGNIIGVFYYYCFKKNAIGIDYNYTIMGQNLDSSIINYARQGFSPRIQGGDTTLSIQSSYYSFNNISFGYLRHFNYARYINISTIFKVGISYINYPDIQPLLLIRSIGFVKQGITSLANHEITPTFNIGLNYFIKPHEHINLGLNMNYQIYFNSTKKIYSDQVFTYQHTINYISFGLYLSIEIPTKKILHDNSKLLKAKPK